MFVMQVNEYLFNNFTLSYFLNNVLCIEEQFHNPDMFTPTSGPLQDLSETEF